MNSLLEKRIGAFEPIAKNKITFEEIEDGKHLHSVYGTGRIEQGAFITDDGSLIPLHLTQSQVQQAEKFYDPFMPAKEIELVDIKTDSRRSNQAWREARRQERAEARRELKNQYTQYRNGFVFERLDKDEVKRRYKAIVENARQQRLDVRKSPSSLYRKAMYSVIAWESMKKRHELKMQLKKEREALKQDPENQRLTYRAWVEEQAEKGNQIAINRLRGMVYQEQREIKALQAALLDENTNGLLGDREADPVAQTVDGLQSKVQPNGEIHYQDDQGITALVDLGQRINVPITDSTDDNHLNQALKIASQRFKTVRPVGDAAFKARVKQAVDGLKRQGSAIELDLSVKASDPKDKTHQVQKNQPKRKHK